MKSLITSLLLASTLIVGAQTPISSLPTATVANSGDVIVLVQSGVTKQLTVANLVNATTNANATITSNIVFSFSTVTQVTNAIAANALLSANGLGKATNANMYAPNDNPFGAALNLWSYPNNINSESLALYSIGEASFAGIHHENITDTLAVDEGLWGNGFGPAYTGSYLIDLYTRVGNGVGTNPGPQFKIVATGKSTVVPDSGVTSHPFITINPTNGFIDLMLWLADSRAGKTGFHFDPTKGVQELITSSTNIFNGSGTITGSGRTITGVNTKFLTECTLGTIIANVANVGMVIAITSDTLMTVNDPISISGGSSYTVQRPEFTSRDNLGNSNIWFSANGNILSVGTAIGGGVQPLTWKDNSQTWSIQHGGSQMNLHNHNLNGNPFFVNDSTPDSSLGLDASGNITIQKNILYSTNAQTTVINMNNRFSDVTTNATFAWVGFTGLSTSQYQFTTIFLTNTSGGLINFTAPINTHTNGTFNCTNGGVTMVEFRLSASRWTNAVATPLF